MSCRPFAHILLRQNHASYLLCDMCTGVYEQRCERVLSVDDGPVQCVQFTRLSTVPRTNRVSSVRTRPCSRCVRRVGVAGGRWRRGRRRI
ncbi:unnamed protein product [Sphagnum balticum]